MSSETSSNEVFNRRINIIIAVVVAIIAVLSSFITKLESEASTESSKASIAEQQYYYQTIGTQISGGTDVSYAFGTVYQLWYQYEVQRLSAQKRGEADAATTYTNLRDAVAKTSTLFEPKYFDADTASVNILLYEADTYRRKLYELEEKQTAANQVAAAWDEKSSKYTLQLTLLAVAGFLLGLALMTKGRIPTLVFATSGIVLVVVISSWAYQVSRTSIVERPPETITAFAQGASFVDQREWEQALVLLTSAIEESGAENPFGRAYLFRAQAQSALGNFEEAIKDYQAAINSGFTDDPTVQASLVQAYFYIGDFQKAIQTGNEALKNSPNNLGLHQQVIMATLASGYIRTASEETTVLLERAAEQAKKQREFGDNDAVAKIGWFLNDAAHQYEQLAALLETNAIDSPIRKNINDPISVRKKAEELAGQIRASTIALKYDINIDKSSVSNPSTKIEIKSITPSKTPDQKYIYKVDMGLAYSEVETGQLLSIITYRNGIEEPSWNFSQEWTNPQKTGTATFTLSPSYSGLYIVPPGLYTVSIYLNSDLLANGEFSVEDPDEPVDIASDNTFAFSLLDPLDLYTGDYDSYFYDPFFFFSEANYYFYFLEESYDFYTGYCADPNDLICFTAKDIDGDGTSDEFDFCPLDPGPFENYGCPVSTNDSDGDDITNDFDLCPYAWGLKETNGCPTQETGPDSDGDGTTDTLDLCPFEPGSTENSGCPVATDDTDGDGTTDNFDACPYTPGLEDNNGCPLEDAESDLDGDGVPDTIDFCVDQPGPSDYNGCPLSTDDADGDGVSDSIDTCPYAAGPEENKGCPTADLETDSDGDGILDANDLCPSEIGLPENGGCPATSASDFDGDGIADSDDACPYDPGPSSNGGCPDVPSDPDTDGDGISDSKDACPYDQGPSSNGGCPDIPSDPDSDGDGLLDSEDSCPYEAGPTENGGCP